VTTIILGLGELAIQNAWKLHRLSHTDGADRAWRSTADGDSLGAEDEAAIAASVAINFATLAATGGDGWLSGLSWRYVTSMQVGNARLLFEEICSQVGWTRANRPRRISEACAERWPLFDLSQTKLRTRAQVRLLRTQLANQQPAARRAVALLGRIMSTDVDAWFWANYPVAPRSPQEGPQVAWAWAARADRTDRCALLRVSGTSARKPPFSRLIKPNLRHSRRQRARASRSWPDTRSRLERCSARTTSRDARFP
jgi:hypothetical protein